MRFCFASYGSSGDVYPLVTLGKTLIARGHSVCLACPSLFQTLVESAGLDWIPLFENERVPPVRDLMEAYSHVDNPLRLLKAMHSLTLPAFDETVQALDAVLAETDCFLSSYLFSNLNAIAQRRKIPCVSIAFAHNVVPLENEPPDQVPALRWLPPTLRKLYTRTAWKVGDRFVSGKINHILRHAQKRNKLTPMRSFFHGDGRKMLVAVSPKLFRPKHNFDHEHFIFSGFLPPPAEVAGKLCPETLQFLNGQRCPLITFGSISPRGGLRALQQFVDNWPSNEKLLIQAGWSDLEDLQTPANIRVIGSVAHQALLPHISVAAHHGGAGTTASLLRHGIPSVMIPHIADQRFWAREVIRIGAGVALREKHWQISLPMTLLELRDNAEVANKTREAASILSHEDGAALAADHLESEACWGNASKD
jgi:UDP:flavonoid glycosyltransferase YjiC (YdhE family)